MNAIVLVVLIVASATCKPVTEIGLSSDNNALPPVNHLTPEVTKHLPLSDEAVLKERLPADAIEDGDQLEPWGEEDEEDVPEEELGAEEGMEGSENVAFRPLFVYRKREARRAAERAARHRRARGSERVGYFVPYARTYRRFRQRPAYLRPQQQDPPLQILY